MIHTRKEFIITGISRLTGLREQISNPMSKEDAEARLVRELKSRTYIKKPAYTRLKIEEVVAMELLLKF